MLLSHDLKIVGKWWVKIHVYLLFQKLFEKWYNGYQKHSDKSVIFEHMHPLPSSNKSSIPAVICTAHKLGHPSSKLVEDIPEVFDIDGISQYSHMMHTLILDQRNIPALPDGFFKYFPHVEMMQLTSLGLSSLPEGISNILKLRSLDLGNNKLKQLPGDFASCASNLNTLALSNNPLYELPEVVYSCTELTQLEINNIGLKDMSADIGKLQKLEYLAMGSHALPTLPACFGQLMELRVLNAMGVPWIEGQDNASTLLGREPFQEFCAKTHLLASMSHKVLKSLHFLLD